MSEHFDSKPGQIRWTDDEILGALEEMNKRLPSGAHSAIAVMRMMRDSYEITRQSANRHIASQEARIADLEAQLAAEQEKAGHYYQETAAIVAETCAENERLKAQLAQTWQPLNGNDLDYKTLDSRVGIWVYGDNGNQIGMSTNEIEISAMLPANIRLSRRVERDEVQPTIPPDVRETVAVAVADWLADRDAAIAAIDRAVAYLDAADRT